MSVNSNKVGIILNSWEEDGGTARYAVKLSSWCDETFFDLLSGKPKIYGQFSSVKKINASTYEALRDPLGISKLFYTETEDRKLFFSEQFTALSRYKTKIFSVPAGMHVRIGSNGQRDLIRDIRPIELKNDKFRIDYLQSGKISQNGLLFQKKLEIRLEHAFSLIKNLEDSGWKIFIALSGGLDSSIIANYSVKHLTSPIACTLDLGESEDAEKSSLIARELGIKHLMFDTCEDEILQALNNAPLLCQDFRDFNVHCATLNLLLAKNIRTWVDTHYQKSSGKIIVLTGDLMNEYTCDYEEEVIDDRVYYRLPNVGKKDLQQYLIRGIDTSDRELLPFRHYGLHCIQPYAVLFDLYSNLDEDILQIEGAKNFLNSFLVPNEVRNIVPEIKLRAQIGNKDTMGILGLCHRLGLTNEYFQKKILEQSRGTLEQIPIFVGKYDVEVFL